MPRIFVRRGCVDTYERLREVFAEEPDVKVLWDRRDEERRSAARRQAGAGSRKDPERRKADRRRSSRRKPNPPTWLTLDFIVTD